MKNTSHLSGVLFFFLLLIVSSESIRLLSTKHGEEIKLMKITNEGLHQTTVEEHSLITELMGLESCQNGDEECNERRMASEAPLDYIYTQKKVVVPPTPPSQDTFRTDHDFSYAQNQGTLP